MEVKRFVDENEKTAVITFHNAKVIPNTIVNMERELRQKAQDETKQYWKMVSLLAAVLNHNNLIETEHQDDICFYTKQVYLQLQKNYPEYGITEEEIERFQSDFRIVANFFVKKRKNKDYIPDDPTEIKHVDEVLKLLQVMTRDERYQTIFQEKKGVHSMCDVAERLEKMGMEKGKEEEKIRVYKKLIEKGFSEQEAQEITELPKPLEV